MNVDFLNMNQNLYLVVLSLLVWYGNRFQEIKVAANH